jgi:hypothetical protein
MKLGGGMFLVPGIGGGGFFGTRSVPIPGTEKQNQESSLSGGLGKLDLGLVYYTSTHFNLKAGPTLMLRVGSEKPEEGEGPSFTTLDAGFQVGVAYVF